MSTERSLLNNISEFKKTLALKEADLRRNLTKEPQNLAIMHDLACCLALQERYAEAVTILQKIIAIAPDQGQAYGTLGYALTNLNDFAAAKQAYLKGIQLIPTDARMLSNLASLCNQLNQSNDAANYLTKAYQLNSEDPFVKVNYVRMLKSNNEIAAAEKILQQNLAQATPAELAELGDIYACCNKNKLALETLDHALQLEPNNYHALSYKAKIQANYEQESLNQNICQKIIAIMPQDLQALGLLQKANLALGDFQAAKAVKTKLANLDINTSLTANPFLGQILNLSLSNQFKIAQKFAAQVNSYSNHPPFVHPPAPRKKIHIGYISADFGDHPVALLIEPILKLHNKDKFDISVFATKQHQHPRYNNIKNLVTTFIDLSNDNAYAAAQKIFATKVDVLIDLTGPMAFDCYNILQYKPAPIICQWLGYTGSSGARFIDYQITTKTIAPPEFAEFYSEKLIYLPDTEVPCPDISFEPLAVTRKDYGLPDDALIMFAQHSAYRIDETIFSSWLKILQAVPKAILWLQCADVPRQKNYLNYAQKYGIDTNRIVFIKDKKLNPLGHHRLADLFMDTFNFTAGTLSLLTAAANLPMLTTLGNTPQARVAASYCLALDMPEQIAADQEDYIQKAIKLLQSPEELRKLKQKLIANKQNSILFKPKLFITQLEEVLVQLTT